MFDGLVVRLRDAKGLRHLARLLAHPGREFHAVDLEAAEAQAQDRPSGESRELDFMPWAGAYNCVPSDATAFVHRDERFQLKHAAVVDPRASTGARQAAHRWVTRSWASVHRWGSGRVFPNFPDPELEDWAGAYYGPNYQRLVRVKARNDRQASSTFTSRSLPAEACRRRELVAGRPGSTACGHQREPAMAGGGP